MRVTISIALSLALAATAFAQDKNKDQRNQPPIRVCVAQLRNISQRPVAVVVPQTRLVKSLRETKPPKHATDQRRIESVALQGDSPGNVGSEVGDNRCDYVVYDTVVELREKSDPVWQSERDKSITFGTQAPISSGKEPETFAEVQFSLRRPGGSNPVMSSSVSGREAANEEITVERLMDQIAQRVNGAVREAPEPMRE